MKTPITTTQKNAMSVARGAAAAVKVSWPIRRSGYMAAAKPVIVMATVPAAAICAQRNRRFQSRTKTVNPRIPEMATKGIHCQARRRVAKRGASTLATGISRAVRKPRTNPAIIPWRLKSSRNSPSLRTVMKIGVR